jgi:predicted dehydrogenase
VIASPQTTHRQIALAAFAAGKPVFCEKPLGASLDDARAMAAAAASAGLAEHGGLQLHPCAGDAARREMIEGGEIGDSCTSAPNTPRIFWRIRRSRRAGARAMPARAISAICRRTSSTPCCGSGGPVERLVADVQTVYPTRPGANGPEAVTNDDQLNLLCRLDSGVMGSIHVSRVATGRKMGYGFDITGTRGALRFDAEDQNALWYYDARAAPRPAGFREAADGPEHPDFLAFCEGAGHGTGYAAQIIIEARDFLQAIDTRQPVFPTFDDGLQVSRVIAAAFRSHAERRWVPLAEFQDF